MESISSKLDESDLDETECNETKPNYSLDSHNTLHGIGTNIYCNFTKPKAPLKTCKVHSLLA